MSTHIDREYTAFLDRVRDMGRKTHRIYERNRWVEPIALTRQKNYDQETDRLLGELRKQRKDAA